MNRDDFVAIGIKAIHCNYL